MSVLRTEVVSTDLLGNGSYLIVFFTILPSNLEMIYVLPRNAAFKTKEPLSTSRASKGPYCPASSK